MVSPAAGKVVLVPFPFPDLSQAKLRPAVIVADAGRGDWVLCQITSNPYADPRAVKLAKSSFATDSLQIESFARAGKLFTASVRLMRQEIGVLKATVGGQIVDAIIAMLERNARRSPGTHSLCIR